LSVLIEAVSLVVPVITLDATWPGGVSAFTRDVMSEPRRLARHVCADGALVSVSFLHPADARVVVAELREHGLMELDPLRAHDVVIVDQEDGPALPCAWLDWKRDRLGVTCAWVANRTPGEMAVPTGWTPASAPCLTRIDRRDEPGRMLKLAEDGELETWLDFKTGEVVIGMRRLGGTVRGGA
jgi:hypothetical protein